MKKLVWLVGLLLLATGMQAQAWSGILDPKRAIDWSAAGAGAIPDRATHCTNWFTASGVPSNATGVNGDYNWRTDNSTMYKKAAGAWATTGHTAIVDLNAAVAGCAANQTVFLNAGSYTFGSDLTIIGQSNVTVKGAGANLTFLTFTAGGNGGIFYVSNNDTNNSNTPHNVADWTAGYAAGTTVITLNSVTPGTIANLFAGSLLVLDQLDDTTDTGDMFVNQQTLTTREGGSGIGRPGSGSCTSGCRAQNQQVTVVSCVGANALTCSGGLATAPYTVTIAPGLYAPNWRSGQSPGAWWSNALPTTGVWFEDFSVNVSAATVSGRGAIFYFQNVKTSGVRRIKSVNGTTVGSAWNKHVWFYQSINMTARDSYFYGAQGANESYGVDTGYSSADNLVENNIAQHIATAWIREGDVGSVIGHNYAVDNYYTNNGTATDWQQGDTFNHGFGYYGLQEADIGSEMELDDIHGSSFAMTGYRDYWTGFDPGGGGTKTGQTQAIQVYAYSRYVNLVDSVMGKTGYHTTYSTEAPNGTNCGSFANLSVMSVGWSGDTGTRFAPLATCASGYGAAFSINNDTLAVSTMMRWGNYDTVGASIRFVSGEKGNAAPTYPALTNPSQTFPASFYLPAGKPTWYGNGQYPSIGGDVTGGTGPGNHVFNNPAASCYLNTMGGLTNGTSGVLAFDPIACYYTAVVVQPPTAVGVKIQ